MSKDNYKGFSLMNDIEDNVLRTRNRAVVLTNMYVDNSQGSKTTPKGAAMILGYFNSIPKEERLGVQERFIECMKERGFKIA